MKHDQNKANQAAEKFEDAIDQLETLVSTIREAKRLHRESQLDVGYSLAGHVDAYVLNHLTGDFRDSIENELEQYVMDIEMALRDGEEETGEEA